MTPRNDFAIPVRLAMTVALVGILSGCSGSAPDASNAAPGLEWTRAASLIELSLDDPAHQHAFWGMTVVDLSTGETILERSPNLNMIPASNVKLYTTAAALEVLGPSFTFETVIATPGYQRNDTLFGPLIVRGSGDPSIGGRFTDGDELAIFRGWARQLRERGIRHIEGDIVGDDNAFDDIPLGYGWSWDDEAYWYSAELGALSFNDNCIDLTVNASRTGEAAEISWRPLNTSYVEITNHSLTVAADSLADEKYARKRATNTIVVDSRVEVGGSDTESLSVSNPTAYFVHVLRDVFELEGIGVNGYPVDIDDTTLSPTYGDLTTLIRHQSRPLKDIVAVVNKRSQNLYADQLLKAMGSLRPEDEAEEPGGSAENGLAVAAGVWTAAGIDTSTVQIVDGSGLSRYNLTTTTATSKLLAYMWTRPDSIKQAFMESLPIGGIDGTLSGRYPEGRARGLVRAKTGTVSNVSALSGYVETVRGTPIAFSLMSNNFVVDTDDIRDVQDRIVGWLASVRDR